jgi:DUF4097 and DUF4098 domain-containing protein YvlB
VRYLILLAVVALWTGCKGGIDKTLQQVVEETYRLEPTGNLHVKNVDGTIRLYGWDKPEVRIKATKKAYSIERLRAITMQVASRPESLSIETVFPPGKKWSLRDRSGVIEYVIVMPQHLKGIELELTNGEVSIDGLRGGNAHASVVNGRISARNCFANLDYQATNGAIDFYYNWWETVAYLVKATIPNGAIGVFLPAAASFHVEAETQGGSIISNLIDEGEPSHDHRKKITRTFGSDGGPTFQFKAVNGNIRIQGY